MRATSGTWLHAQLTLLVAACFSSACGGSTSRVDAGGAGAGKTTGGTGGSGAQGGELAQGGAEHVHGGAPGLVCRADTWPNLTAGWRTDPPVDYVAKIWKSQDGVVVQEESGVRCSGASSKAHCEAAYEALVPSVSWNSGGPLPVEQYFTYTRGDDVGTIGDGDQLLAVLGTIDTPNEAAVWLSIFERETHCDDLETVLDGYVGHTQQELADCPISYQPVDVRVAPDGTLTETKYGEVVETNVCSGRRPDGLLVAQGERGGNQLGAYFAQMAELELASIAAFAALERQLAAHGAPLPLLLRCRRARADEIGHARSVAELARRFGARPNAVRVAPQYLPSLRQLALENAREGCVRELYGAAVATWQSVHAREPQVREVFSRIARDESEHAALALDLSAWLGQHLSEAEREEVEAERQRAVEQLRAELLAAPDERTQAIAGVPSAARAAALLTALWRPVHSGVARQLLS